MTDARQDQKTPPAPYEKPVVEKKLSKEDLEREFLYAGTTTKPTAQPGP